MNMDMSSVKNLKKNKIENNDDNSVTVVNNTNSNPGGIVISNTANTTNETTNDTVNEDDIVNEQSSDQNTDTGSGISMDMLLFGLILTGVYMYGKKLRGK